LPSCWTRVTNQLHPIRIPAVVSRQFVEMPRSRIEGLLAAFPKLIDPKNQHTFVETDAVRYVYQPLDDLYMILVTNKSSNILQDIETVHLFSRAVSEQCKTFQEREIAKNAFELIFAFDELVALGYAEGIDVATLRTILEMESAEERIQAEIERVRGEGCWSVLLPVYHADHQHGTVHRTRKRRPKNCSSSSKSRWNCKSRRLPSAAARTITRAVVGMAAAAAMAVPTLATMVA
jgi:hypothetical protein